MIEVLRDGTVILHGKAARGFVSLMECKETGSEEYLLGNIWDADDHTPPEVTQYGLQLHCIVSDADIRTELVRKSDDGYVDAKELKDAYLKRFPDSCDDGSRCVRCGVTDCLRRVV